MENFGVDMDVLAVAEENQRQAWQMVEQTGVFAAWESVGAEVHLVGSLKTGLLMKHRDIDFHIHTASLNVCDSFTAMQRLASNPMIKRVEYRNLADTNEQCIEWHAWAMDRGGNLWQLDMIHLFRGSAYDGYFERVADRVLARLTPATKRTILELKNQTPETEKIMGIEYYQAVLEGRVSTWSEFLAWRQLHPAQGIVEWMP